VSSDRLDRMERGVRTLSAVSTVFSAVFWFGLWLPAAIFNRTVSSADIRFLVLFHLVVLLPAAVVTARRYAHRLVDRGETNE